MQFTNSLVVLASFLAATNALVAVPRDVDIETRDYEIEAREPKGAPPKKEIDGCSISNCILALVASGAVVGDCKGMAEDPSSALDALSCLSSVAGLTLDVKTECANCMSAMNKNRGKGKKFGEGGKVCKRDPKKHPSGGNKPKGC